MRTEFRRVDPVREMRSLLAFDRKAFAAADRFEAWYWRELESYWLLVDRVKAGCCAFERDRDFQDDVRRDGEEVVERGSLYIATTAILPRFQGMGLGSLLKAWQVAFARRNRFRRIVTNTSKRNRAMIALNRKFGFVEVRTTGGYYREPVDATVVMELRLAAGEKRRR